MKKLKVVCLILIISFITSDGITFFILQKRIDRVLSAGEDLETLNKNILSSLKFMQSKQVVLQKNVLEVSMILSDREKKISEEILSAADTVLDFEKKHFQYVAAFQIKTASSFAHLEAAIHSRREADPEDGKNAESDAVINNLLKKGKMLFGEEEYAEAKQEYKKILTLNSRQSEALIYYNASIYYRNPGDESNYPGIKKSLIPLIQSDELTAGEKRTVLEVLAGISREEGDTASLKKYQSVLEQPGAER